MNKDESHEYAEESILQTYNRFPVVLKMARVLSI